jgi:hypothetical protein
MGDALGSTDGGADGVTLGEGVGLGLGVAVGLGVGVAPVVGVAVGVGVGVGFGAVTVYVAAAAVDAKQEAPSQASAVTLCGPTSLGNGAFAKSMTAEQLASKDKGAPTEAPSHENWTPVKPPQLPSVEYVAVNEAVARPWRGASANVGVGSMV